MKPDVVPTRYQVAVARFVAWLAKRRSGVGRRWKGAPLMLGPKAPLVFLHGLKPVRANNARNLALHAAVLFQISRTKSWVFSLCLQLATDARQLTVLRQPTTELDRAWFWRTIRRFTSSTFSVRGEQKIPGANTFLRRQTMSLHLAGTPHLTLRHCSRQQSN